MKLNFKGPKNNIFDFTYSVNRLKQMCESKPSLIRLILTCLWLESYVDSKIVR